MLVVVANVTAAATTTAVVLSTPEGVFKITKYIH